MPSILQVTSQIAQLGPFSYMLIKVAFPTRVKVSRVIFFVLSIGAVSCFLLAIYWNKTAFIFHEKRSIYLYIFNFSLSILGKMLTKLLIWEWLSVKPLVFGIRNKIYWTFFCRNLYGNIFFLTQNKSIFTSNELKCIPFFNYSNITHFDRKMIPDRLKMRYLIYNFHSIRYFSLKKSSFY